MRGEGFLAFSNSSSRARCRWGADTNGTLLEAVREANGTMHETPAIEISSSHLVCRAHPKANAGSRELYVSLNGVDFGGSGMGYKYYRQLTNVQLAPTGGLVSGGTPVTFLGHGFDGLFGALNDTLCRWGNESSSPVTAPTSIAPTQLVCPSFAQPGPRSVDVSIALNRIDYAALDLDFKFYNAPTVSLVSPDVGSSNGGARVTIDGRGFLGFTTDQSLGRCSFGGQTTSLLRLTDEQVVCSSATRPPNATAALERPPPDETPVELALNGVDFTPAGIFTFFSERVNTTRVEGGPTGGPALGGTILTVVGDGLQGVTHCKFGNGTAMPVLSASFGALTCPSSQLGEGAAADGAAFLEGPREESISAAAAKDYTQEALVLANYKRGFVPLLLSRGDASGFFFTANYFYFYPAPANFTSVLPRGGPVMDGPTWRPTAVTITGEGFLGFDGQAAQARCRWGGAEAANDVTTPISMTDTAIVCESYARQTAGTVELYVSLNSGADFHATGQTFVFYPQPVMLRTGCLGAVKGCLTTGPTTGNNPMKVSGIGCTAGATGRATASSRTTRHAAAFRTSRRVTTTTTASRRSSTCRTAARRWARASRTARSWRTARPSTASRRPRT